jgi:hypothetical protein
MSPVWHPYDPLRHPFMPEAPAMNVSRGGLLARFSLWRDGSLTFGIAHAVCVKGACEGIAVRGAVKADNRQDDAWDIAREST